MKRFWCLLLAGMAAVSVRADMSGPHAQVLPNDVMGVVLQADGETPVAGFPVRVWNVERNRFVYRTKTDANGNFYIPPMASGSSYVMCGRVKINIDVLQPDEAFLAQRHDLIVALPRRALITGNMVLYDTIISAAAATLPPEEPQVVSP